MNMLVIEKKGTRWGEEVIFGEVREHPKELEEAVCEAADEGFNLCKWMETTSPLKTPMVS
jgi:hypothetical protein